MGPIAHGVAGVCPSPQAGAAWVPSARPSASPPSRQAIAVGRKNHYGSRSERGTRVAALHESVWAGCQAFLDGWVKRRDAHSDTLDGAIRSLQGLLQRAGL